MRKAKNLSEKFTTGRCQTPFMFIYQPFQLDPSRGVREEFIDKVHKPFTKIALNAQNGIDVSKVFKERTDFYIDLSHTTQEGKRLIADTIIKSEKFKAIISGCSILKEIKNK